MKNAKVKMTLRQFFLIFVMYALFFCQVYSYVGTPFKLVEDGSYAYRQNANSDSITITINMVIIFVILFWFFLDIANRRSNIGGTYTLISFALILGVTVWTILTAIDIGFSNLMYEGSAPFVYLTALMFVVGMDEKLFLAFLEHIKILGTISLLLSMASYVWFLSKHSGAVLGDSSVLRYYIQGFWFLCIYSFHSQKSNKTIIYLVIISCGILAIMFNSRSWIVQTVIWLLTYTYCTDRQKGLIRLLKVSGSVLIIIAITYFAVNKFFPQIFEMLLNKVSVSETRSGQYKDLFAQTEFIDYILGRGQNFKYYSSIQKGMYAYIDNSYLFMLIRYGLIVGLSYTLVFVVALFKLKFSKSTIPILMWMMALGGLSVYCTTIIDLKSIALPIVVGRCIYLEKKKKAEIEQ